MSWFYSRPVQLANGDIVDGRVYDEDSDLKLIRCSVILPNLGLQTDIICSMCDASYPYELTASALIERFRAIGKKANE